MAIPPPRGPQLPPPPGPQRPPPPGPPEGYYPQQAYYAPGWTGPAAPPSPRRRRGAILAAVITLAAVVVLGGAAWGIGYWLQTRSLGEIDAPTTATTRQVTVGHCMAELPRDGSVARVRLVPCAEPHEAEVVGVLALGPGPWPGQESVEAQVERWCEMDTAQQEAGFTAVAWTPSARGWAQGDTQGVCIAWFEGGGVTGSWAEGDVVTG
jgi:hypothetical protein